MQSATLGILLVCLASISNGFVCRSTSAILDARAVPSSCALHASDSGARESIVERCYEAWNRRRMSDAAACFDDDFAYDDGQYLGSIQRKSDLERLFQRGAMALPPKVFMVVDQIARCAESGNVGTQWHVEKDDGSIVPFTRGCSFYTIDEVSGLIKTGFRVSEMIAKPSKQLSDMVVSSASGMMQLTDRMGTGSILGTKTEEAKPESIIETYFDTWNDRDMEAALDCFVEDCVYETEDGKEALRQHLLRNVEALPSACQIIPDDLALDSINGTCGVKWHLEANGIPIPNLRGCSMYTTDGATGLLKTGFDVTEAPVKLPGFAQDVLAVPFGKLLF
ncbi:hypothetical protein ACHAWF_006091 [Thalassiosira exigua]